MNESLKHTGPEAWKSRRPYLSFARKLKNDIQYARAPFGNHELGVNWAKKKIYYSKECPWPDVLHEMAHVFASKYLPDQTDEWDFFGWEIGAVKLLKGSITEWATANRYYEINIENYELESVCDCLPLSAIPKPFQRKIFAERINHAHETGLLKRRKGKLVPVAIR